MPNLGLSFKKYNVTTEASYEVNSGFSNAGGNVNGAPLCGEGGTTKVETKRWFDILDTSDMVLFFEMQGSLSDDVEIKIEACLIGGEGFPTVLATVNPTTVQTVYTIKVKSYDRVRANIVKHESAGTGSQVIMSGR